LGLGAALGDTKRHSDVFWENPSLKRTVWAPILTPSRAALTLAVVW
jgi:hypothetical protein